MAVTTDTPEIVEDAFLNHRVRLRQPKQGYRAATDPVLLAASMPVIAGDSVLDLGCGAGAATFCLGARVEGLDLHGLELQHRYSSLARQNADLNGQTATIHDGDIRAMPHALKERVFDAVMLNPPWHGSAASGSPDQGRDVAHRLDTTLAVWVTAALTRAKPGGWIVLIQRAEWLSEILAALTPRTGDIAVLPLAARTGRPAKRIIVKARKGTNGPLKLASPLVLHDGPAHVADQDDFSAAAKAVLRDAEALDF